MTEKILKMATPLKVRGIGSPRYESDKFVFISLHFPDINLTNRLAYAHIYRELYIVEGLKANMLIGNNILPMERVIINLAKIRYDFKLSSDYFHCSQTKKSPGVEKSAG